MWIPTDRRNSILKNGPMTGSSMDAIQTRKYISIYIYIYTAFDRARDIKQLIRTLYLSQESRFGLAVSSIHSRAENGERDAFATVVGR